jgi:hypothetical protein
MTWFIFFFVSVHFFAVIIVALIPAVFLNRMNFVRSDLNRSFC